MIYEEHEADHQEEEFEGLINEVVYEEHEAGHMEDKFGGRITEARGRKFVRQISVEKKPLKSYEATAGSPTCGGDPRVPHAAECRESTLESTEEDYTERIRLEDE